jgi:hypothetical protein
LTTCCETKVFVSWLSVSLCLCLELKGWCGCTTLRGCSEVISKGRKEEGVGLWDFSGLGAAKNLASQFKQRTMPEKGPGSRSRRLLPTVRNNQTTNTTADVLSPCPPSCGEAISKENHRFTVHMSDIGRADCIVHQLPRYVIQPHWKACLATIDYCWQTTNCQYMGAHFLGICAAYALYPSS